MELRDSSKSMRIGGASIAWIAGSTSCANRRTLSSKAVSSISANRRRGALKNAGPSLRLKRLPHNPRNAIGITGTGFASTICLIPFLKGPSSPSLLKSSQNRRGLAHHFARGQPVR